MGNWGVFEVNVSEVHVMPCDEAGFAVGDHRPTLDCPCQPRLVRDAPLDEPIISHREPRHPGAMDRLQ